MPKLHRTSARKILAALLRAGFYVHHQTGGHINLRHKVKIHLHVVVPRQKRDIFVGTLKSIIKQSGLNTEDFIKLS